jgi:HlyD family secretion protein
MSTQLFRKAALDRLASPEELDTLLTVTHPRRWIALAALWLGLAVALAWGIMGTIPTKVVGHGMLIQPGGVVDVFAPAGGRITEIAVSEGALVIEGQVVARLAQPELEHELENARADLADLEGQDSQQTRANRAQLDLERESLLKRRANLEEKIATGTEQLHALAESVRAQEQLLEQGLVTRQAMIAVRAAYYDVRNKIEEARGQLKELSVTELRVASDSDLETLQGSMKVSESRRRVRLAEAQLDLASRVVAPFAGRVLELRARPSDWVRAGDSLLSLSLLQPGANALSAVVYVPSEYGKSVQPGMAAQVSPATARREEYGFVRGAVGYVSEFPSTKEGMTRVLANEELVRSLMGEGPPFAVYVGLEADPGGPSGYRWSSQKGAQVRIHSGTPCTVEIVTREQHPIELILPTLRAAFGA